MVAIPVGVAAEGIAYEWRDVDLWLPDLLVGWVLVGCGAAAWSRRGGRGVGTLLILTGATWFAGFSAESLYWHRGLLVHLLLTYPGVRPRSRAHNVGFGVGYLAALAPPVWRNELVSLSFAVALVAVVSLGYAQMSWRERRRRRPALRAAALMAAALVAGGVARMATPTGDAAAPALLAYQVAVCLVAVVLLSGLQSPSPRDVTDLVVELGEGRSGTLRDRLARLLDDPTLQVGHWSADELCYLDDQGERVDTHESGGQRAATMVHRDDAPFIVLVHDAQVLSDPSLVDAVRGATRLADSNGALRLEVRRTLGQLAASRRRLLAAADDERRHLEERLRLGPARRLAALDESLRRLPDGGGTSPYLARALGHLTGASADLQELARGLHPHELVQPGAGLPVALAS
ncbi:MAG: hypothetical protein H0V42_07625, partial [Nocardioidaceae bacterium]|nr:hypothetical protein [Nocardioidaceae bacterium]